MSNSALEGTLTAAKRILEQVYDSPTEPDKWYQNVRFVLQNIDGKERPGKTAFQRRDELRVQRAAPELLDALKEATKSMENWGWNCAHKETDKRIMYERLRAAITKAEPEGGGHGSP